MKSPLDPDEARFAGTCIGVAMLMLMLALLALTVAS